MSNIPPLESPTQATQLLANGRQVLAQQPFSVLIGARLHLLEAGRAELSVAAAPALRQQHGFVHGGVLAYLADNALTFAGGSVLGDCVTSEFKMNYLRPAKHAQTLLAVASVVGSGKTQAVCRCDVFASQGEERVLCAVAQGTITKVGR